MHDVLSSKELRNRSFRSIEQLQNRRFHATCLHLLPNVPFYKKLFASHGVDPTKLKSVEAWQKQGLPLIKKATYMKKPKDFVCSPDRKKLFWTHLNYLTSADAMDEAITFLFSNKNKTLSDHYSPKMLVFSGGTESGNPTPVLITARQKFHILQKVLKIAAELIDIEGQKIGMNLFPYGPHLGWHAAHQALDIAADLNLCTAAGGAVPTERLVALAHQAKPNIILGMSEYIRNRFLPLAIERRIKLPEKVLFVNGAQKMHDVERQKIAELAKKVGVKRSIVMDLYAASEFKEALMPECKSGSGFHHIAPLSTIVRTIEVHGTTKEYIDDWDFSEQGYLASWNIDGGGTLLEGYLVGDKAERVSRGCNQCGLKVMKLHNVSRIRDVEAQLAVTGMVEEKIKGTRVNLVAIRDMALSLKEVEEAQVVIRQGKKVEYLELRFVSSAPKQVMKKLEIQFAGAEIKPKLVSTTLDKLAGGKLKFEGIKRE